MTLDWPADTRCRTTNPDLFFSEEPDDTKAAKAVCKGCPVLDSCLDVAMVNQFEGVWGGMTAVERRKHRSKWKRRHGVEERAAIRRRYSVEDESLPSATARYERRLDRAKAAYGRLQDLHNDGPVPNFANYSRVLELILANQHSSSDVLAERLSRSATWFNQTFRDACKLTSC